jgi:hypothetical protein
MSTVSAKIIIRIKDRAVEMSKEDAKKLKEDLEKLLSPEPIEVPYYQPWNPPWSPPIYPPSLPPNIAPNTPWRPDITYCGFEVQCSGPIHFEM